WAAGAILYECLTGRPPHTGATYEQVIVAICMKDADDVRVHNPSVPESVSRVIAHALTRDRAGRFANAREFLDSLAAATGGTMLPRSGRGSADDLASGRAGGTMMSPGQTPMPTAGYEPTLAMKGNPAASRVGWSTTGGSSTGRSRDRRTYLIVA